MKILITGATGFVGKRLCNELQNDNHEVYVAIRKKTESVVEKIYQFEIGDLSAEIDWSKVLQGVEVVVHTAARVHIMNDSVVDPITEFRRVNTAATLTLARQAATSGVKRFIFISSIKVNGEMTKPNHPFQPDDAFIPVDPYALSKYEAEQGLLKVAEETRMELVIIRPPLVYGAGVRANFASMMKWIKIGIPLPLGAVRNQRSFVALDNLVSFIIHCIDHPKAANEIFLISDGEDVSTTELLRKVAKVFGQKAFLLPVPITWMRLVATLMGKSDVTNRLFGSLQVDSSKVYELLGWKQVITMDEQLKKTADAYLNEKAL
ncbi:MAG: SDR family oxidoreductase [Methylococcaceae bacterium]|nr:SDR family oxidoreductase [Methylococcaceae bacterium]